MSEAERASGGEAAIDAAPAHSPTGTSAAHGASSATTADAVDPPAGSPAPPVARQVARHVSAPDQALQALARTIEGTPTTSAPRGLAAISLLDAQTPAVNPAGSPALRPAEPTSPAPGLLPAAPASEARPPAPSVILPRPMAPTVNIAPPVVVAAVAPTPSFPPRPPAPLAASANRDAPRPQPAHPATAVPRVVPSMPTAPSTTPTAQPGTPPSIGAVRPGAPTREFPVATSARGFGASAPSASASPAAPTLPPPTPAAPPTAAPPTAASPSAQAPRPSPLRRAWRLVRRLVRIVLIGVAAYMLVAVALVAVFRTVDPPTSALMLLRGAMGETVTQRWVPMEAISPNLARAVVLSEDGNFCRHHGIDFGELKAAIERARDGIPRGASTITMQVAKNLLLFPAKSYLRKAMELPLTLAIEAMWSKRRILEVYLNIAEWGPGIYGAEAAARHHFDRAARRLSDAEAALLAVSLPNPIERDAGDPGPGTERLAHRIQARMQSNPRAAACAMP